MFLLLILRLEKNVYPKGRILVMKEYSTLIRTGASPPDKVLYHTQDSSLGGTVDVFYALLVGQSNWKILNIR